MVEVAEVPGVTLRLISALGFGCGSKLVQAANELAAATSRACRPAVG